MIGLLSLYCTNLLAINDLTCLKNAPFRDSSSIFLLPLIDMKQIVLITILFLFSQTTFAQRKVQESERTNQELQKAHIDNFVVNLLKEP